MRAKWIAPAVSVGVVVVIVVTLSFVIGGGREPSVPPLPGSGPRVLHLTSRNAELGAAAPVASPSTSAYKLDGTLPSGTPSPRPVWYPLHATAADAARVARALGVAATPVNVSGGWVARDGHNLLAVRVQGPWSYGEDCAPDRPIAEESLDVMCATATAGTAVATGTAVAVPRTGSTSGRATASPPPPATTPAPMPTPPPGPSEARARADAAPVLDGLGLADAVVTVNQAGPTTFVTAAPRVDGADTSGWETRLSYDASDRLVTAGGWLTGVEKGDSYPLITAQRAFELLQQRPQPMMALCPVTPDGKGCLPRQTVVTGAVLGLATDIDVNRPVLVPAWLFTVKDSPEPVAQVAVNPSYLASPAPAPSIGPPSSSGVSAVPAPPQPR